MFHRQSKDKNFPRIDDADATKSSRRCGHQGSILQCWKVLENHLRNTFFGLDQGWQITTVCWISNESQRGIIDALVQQISDLVRWVRFESVEELS